MTIRILSVTAAVTIATLALGACGGMSQRQNVYQAGMVQQQMKVKLATVIVVRDVTIESQSTGVGATAGSASGAIASMGFDSRHGIIAGIAGAVVGGIVGAAAEKGMSGKKGQEIIYQVDGTTDAQALVQETDDSPLRPGDRVCVIEGSFSTRLVRQGSSS